MPPLGLVSAAVVSESLRGFLFRVQPLAPVTFAAVADCRLRRCCGVGSAGDARKSGSIPPSHSGTTEPLRYGPICDRVRILLVSHSVVDSPRSPVAPPRATGRSTVAERPGLLPWMAFFGAGLSVHAVSYGSKFRRPTPGAAGTAARDAR